MNIDESEFNPVFPVNQESAASNLKLKGISSHSFALSTKSLQHLHPLGSPCAHG